MYAVTLTNYRIIESLRRGEVPSDLVTLLTQLEDFRILDRF